MFEQQVTTKDGTVKRVLADSSEALTEAVKVHKEDQLAPSPDINNPAHGNVVVSEFKGDEPEPVKEPKKEAKKVKKPAAKAVDKEKDMADEARLKDEQDTPAVEARTEGEVEQTEQLRKDAEKQDDPKEAKEAVDTEKKV